MDDRDYIIIATLKYEYYYLGKFTDVLRDNETIFMLPFHATRQEVESGIVGYRQGFQDGFNGKIEKELEEKQ